MSCSSKPLSRPGRLISPSKVEDKKFTMLSLLRRSAWAFVMCADCAKRCQRRKHSDTMLAVSSTMLYEADRAAPCQATPCALRCPAPRRPQRQHPNPCETEDLSAPCTAAISGLGATESRPDHKSPTRRASLRCAPCTRRPHCLSKMEQEKENARDVPLLNSIDPTFELVPFPVAVFSAVRATMMKFRWGLATDQPTQQLCSPNLLLTACSSSPCLMSATDPTLTGAAALGGIVLTAAG